MVLFFAYPERLRPSLATSPPAITDFRWSFELTAYWNGLDPNSTPEFGQVMAQLAHPRTLFEATVSPPQPLPAHLLSFGRPLVRAPPHADRSQLLPHHGGVVSNQGES